MVLLEYYLFFENKEEKADFLKNYVKDEYLLTSKISNDSEGSFLVTDGDDEDIKNSLAINDLDFDSANNIFSSLSKILNKPVFILQVYEGESATLRIFNNGSFAKEIDLDDKLYMDYDGDIYDPGFISYVKRKIKTFKA